LKADKFKTLGGLMSVWCLFDEQTEDGFLESYTLDVLDAEVGFPGISRAMQSVGWLEETPEGLVLPEFETHNGSSAKRRAQDADRKREIRKKSASEEDEKRTREEKRREESIHTPSASAQIAMTLRKHSISASPAHPSVIALAEQQVDLDTLDACCAEVRKAKPNESISVAYVVKKLEGWRSQAASIDVRGVKPKATTSWTLTPQSMSAKARELGIPDARPGESLEQFKSRIIEAINSSRAA
jgi:hypothetical protein